MNQSITHVFLLFFLMQGMSCTESAKDTQSGQILLKNNWSIQSSDKVDAAGDQISCAQYKSAGWYPADMPSTVLAVLVKNKVFPDPYYGTNIQSLPGYVAGNMREMPDDSPFAVPWWFRTTFEIPGKFRNRKIRLEFQSINYRANIWFNGHLLADTTVAEGAYRKYSFDITEYAVPGEENGLALEIFPPGILDLTITWVDWNPTPPDMAMGIWYDVSLRTSGPVIIKNPFVKTDLNLPSADIARLTISAGLSNVGNETVTGILKGKIENIEFSRQITLAPGETKEVIFLPENFPQLVISGPRLWWPATAGPQNLYDLNLVFEKDGEISDKITQRFGIREISYFINSFEDKHTRVFQVNGKNIVIRGGGYLEDMMLRPSKRAAETAIDYAIHMNLNALRMEAPRGTDYLYDLCDEKGILLMVGLTCCNAWENWDNWTPHIENIAKKSWKDIVIRLRNHPSVFTWLYGSDRFPPPRVEQGYIGILDQYDGTRPYASNATQRSSTISGYTGFWMGPFPEVYAYRPPSYWYGKLEFNTEAGPGGEQLPPIETMRKMMSLTDMWPIGKSWDIRLNKNFYPSARDALFSRYGVPDDVEEYSMKSQVLQKEAARAMFEAFARNKYRAGGIIYWMFNAAWPKLYWQLYDYFLAPNGAFYGTKKACEPLHIQYSYDDKAVWVVNGYYRDFKNLKATVKIINWNMEEKYANEAVINISSDENKKVFDIDWPANLGDIFFVKLELKNEYDKLISSNFYWLSKNGDEKADFTGLNKLAGVNLNVSVSKILDEEDYYKIFVDFENPSGSLAFSINPSINNKHSDDLITPVFWDDNYFTLLPNEKRTVMVKFNQRDLDGQNPVLIVKGWNILPVRKIIDLTQNAQ